MRCFTDACGWKLVMPAILTPFSYYIRCYL